ncbi:hypothetical protein JTE90_005201 [Oedothorax gibbosus]|uniref:Calcium uniporter protein n=1 Tax=Oedothorax gibbosus TaxID=931172 RepID=A0AAV6UK18_9ARAC|nr:hypothetical protein JTE90_005201 [Oedothorax gibbosus]
MALLPLKRMPEIAWSLSTLGIWRPNSSFYVFHKRRPPSRSLVRFFASSAKDLVPDGEVSVEWRRGSAVLTVPLPSRRERCRFTLRPLSSTVAALLQEMRDEDRGIDRAALHDKDGTRIASSTLVSSLLRDEFCLVINDQVFLVRPPEQEAVQEEGESCLWSVRARVQQLYEALHVDQHRLEEEGRLAREAERIRAELEPLEERRRDLLLRARRRSTALAWLGLALMGAQFGVLARLTWWEYSWDIMEPVTYFITYGTTVAMYAYFVLTRQEYVLPEVYDRQTLFGFHKSASKAGGLDVHKYNALRDALARVEADLRRLRDPLLRTPAPTS